MMGFLETLTLLLAGVQFVIYFPTPTSFLNVRGLDEMNRGECRMNSALLLSKPLTRERI